MKITIEGFRVFKDPQKLEIKPITILTGKNNSGKSSFGKAIYALLNNFEYDTFGGKNIFPFAAIDDLNTVGNLGMGSFKSLMSNPEGEVRYSFPIVLKNWANLKLDLDLIYNSNAGNAGELRIVRFMNTSGKTVAKIQKSDIGKWVIEYDVHSFIKCYYDKYQDCILFYEFICQNRSKSSILDVMLGDGIDGNNSINSFYKLSKEHWEAIFSDLSSYLKERDIVNAMQLVNRIDFKEFDSFAKSHAKLSSHVVRNSQNVSLIPHFEKILFSDGKSNSKKKKSNVIGSFWEKLRFGGEIEPLRGFDYDSYSDVVSITKLREEFLDIGFELSPYLSDIGYNVIELLSLDKLLGSENDGEPKEYNRFRPELGSNSLLNAISHTLPHILETVMYKTLKQYKIDIFLPSIKTGFERIVQNNDQKHTLENLIQKSWNNLINSPLHSNLGFINTNISKFGIGDELVVRQIENGEAFVMEIRDGDKLINVRDIGFGHAQLLPLIMSVSPGLDLSGANIWIEEPEVHLHPNLQSKLADLFVDSIMATRSKADKSKRIHLLKSPKSIIIETHSEYLIRRLQNLIACGAIDSDMVAIYYFDKDASPVARELPVTRDGQLLENFGPGFMDEASNLIQELFRTNLN